MAFGPAKHLSMVVGFFSRHPVAMIVVLWSFSEWPTTGSAHPAHAKPVNYPFVVGFERFYSSVDSPGHLAEGGMILLNELNCVACHAPPEKWAVQFGGVPGTNLHGVASRLAPVDLEMMIRNPRFLKRDTLMPSLFAGPDRDLSEVEALKHFLASLVDENLPDFPVGDVQAGQRLYHRVGCVACHAPEVGYRPEGLPEGTEVQLAGLPSVPMNLADRYNIQALTKFLLDPLGHRPSGRMPDFQFSEREAIDLAAYLKAGPGLKLPKNLMDALDASGEFVIDPGKVATGKKLFVTKNCIVCHQIRGVDGKPRMAKPLTELDYQKGGGCFSERPLGGLVPYFGLDVVQKKAISLALSRLSGREAFDLAGQVDWTLITLNCYACHERAGKGGPETVREIYFGVNDVGALSLGRWGNIPPRLDRVGRKLTDDWFERVLFRKDSHPKARPYMETRMPHFARERVMPLVEKFRAADIRADPIKIDVSGLPRYQRAHYGRELMGVNGLGCVNCHGVKGKRSLGAPVIDLTETVHRLLPEYFKELLLDPQGTQPGTLMPPLFAGRKKADQEVEQLWTYLKEIDQQRLPDGLLKAEDFELKPAASGKPIVFRTFMEKVGTQAIAVGFPQGVHVAFDAKMCRWRLAWRGRFLDAMTTWDDRYCHPAAVLGESVKEIGSEWLFPDKVARFGGYILDEKGVPTMLYRVDGKNWEDKVEPDGKNLKRTLKLSGEIHVETLKW